MKHSVIYSLLITFFLGSSVLGNLDDQPFDEVIMQDALEVIDHASDTLFSNKTIQTNRLVQENTIFELEELLKKVNEDIHIGLRQLKRDDKHEILAVLKERKKRITLRLEELKKTLPNYNQDKRQGNFLKAMLFITIGAVAGGGTVFWAIKSKSRRRDCTIT